jgi:hypothetical protein
MNIYKVEVTYETVIYATSKTDAERRANYVIRNECDSDPISPRATEVKSLSNLPSGWCGNCIPWDGRNDRTISEHIR